MENYRQIMEKHLGRKLLSNEIVHHIDGNQENNAISNLEITTRTVHTKKGRHSKEYWDNYIKELKENQTIKTFDSLEKSLNTFFTARQKQIVYKRLYGEPLTKTEIEMYSRNIKKRLKAICNEDLHKMAWMLITQ